VTYSRASSATYVETYRDALGREAQRITTVGANVPRIEKEGYLSEGASTNLAVNLNNAWSLVRATRAINDALAPDGSFSAISLIEESVALTHGIEVTYSTTIGTAYTFSVFVKAKNRFRGNIRIGTVGMPSGSSVDFDLSERTVTVISGADSGSITEISNGWFRVQGTATATSSATERATIFLSDSNGSTSYTGDGSSSFLLWGAQVEALGGASSYIKTEGSAVSRAADAMTRPISIGRGNLSVRGKALFAGSESVFLVAISESASNYIGVRSILSTARLNTIIASPTNSFISSSASEDWLSKNNVSLNFSPNNSQSYLGDDLPVVSNNVIVPPNNSISIGSIGTSAPFYGHIEYVKVFDTTLTASEVKSL
jgi:hypothetical protein